MSAMLTYFPEAAYIIQERMLSILRLCSDTSTWETSTHEHPSFDDRDGVIC